MMWSMSSPPSSGSEKRSIQWLSRALPRKRTIFGWFSVDQRLISLFDCRACHADIERESMIFTAAR